MLGGLARRMGAAVGILLVVALAVPAAAARDKHTSPRSRKALTATTTPGTRDYEPYRGLGVWVDAYDYSAPFQDPLGEPPPVTPDSVADMAQLGAHTLYLQAAKADARSPGPLVDDKLVGQFLARAHARGLKVVAWYLPLYGDVEADFAHIKALFDFRAGPRKRDKFDAIALDVEWTTDVPDVAERNNRAVSLFERTRALVGERMAIGAIIYPPTQLEVLNQALWPAFPYTRVGEWADVWMPMAYFTFRSGELRGADTYTLDSVRRLRNNLGDQHAIVHPIGGIADLMKTSDYRAFVRSAQQLGAIGWSVYDYNTTATSAWPQLRAGTFSRATK